MRAGAVELLKTCWFIGYMELPYLGLGNMN